MDTQSIAPLLDSLGVWVAVVLTLFVFSYLLGDNVLFRLAEHIFVGVAVGYATVIAFHNVLVPKLLQPIIEGVGNGEWGDVSLLLVSLLLGLFLLAKPSKTLSWLGNISVAVLMGTGAALAIGGALLGTLLPQVIATTDITRYITRYQPGVGLFSGIVVVVGTAGVLLHFYYNIGREGRLSAVRVRLVRSWGGLGRWFIVIAFGAILATTFLARVTLLAGRVQFLLDAVRGLVGG